MQHCDNIKHKREKSAMYKHLAIHHEEEVGNPEAFTFEGTAITANTADIQMNSSSEFRQPAVHRVVVTRTLPDTDSTVNSGRWRAGAGHAVAAGARACPDGRPGLAGGVHSGRGVRRRGATCVRLRHLRVGVAGLRGAGPAAAGGLAPPRRGGEVRPRVHWVRAHLKPQIRKNITITKYKMVKQEQGSLVFNLQVPEVPPSGQQAAPEQSEVAPSAPQHPANPDTHPVPST